MRCLPRHVAIAIDLSDVAAGDRDEDGDRDRGFRPVEIFLLLSVYNSEGQKYLSEMHSIPRRQVSFN